MIALDMLPQYRGRFAPSPSGLLHFGSLVCALASYLDAKSNNGEWFIRIEDIDEQRCRSDFKHVIIDSLAAHGMQSDEEIIVQSEHLDRYQAAFDKLVQDGLIYPCNCSRKQVKSRGSHYDGFCRNRNLGFEQGYASRLRNFNQAEQFDDRILGRCHIDSAVNQEDIVVKRADGCFSYNLVVVIDDIYQQVSHVVRGSDLLDTTTLQMHLHSLFSAPAIEYAHIPVVATKPGLKLSKQNQAKEIDSKLAISNVSAALILLGFKAEEVREFETIDNLLRFAIRHWQLNLVTKQREFIISTTNDVYSAFINTQFT